MSLQLLQNEMFNKPDGTLRVHEGGGETREWGVVLDTVPHSNRDLARLSRRPVAQSALHQSDGVPPGV